MKQDINFPFTMQFLVERYEIKRQSLLEYTKNHISELNEGGVHARKFGKEWRFDEVAVNRLDEMRGYLGTAIATNNYETAEMVRIKDLEQELDKAKAEIAQQKEWLDSQARTMKNQLSMLEANENRIKFLADNNAKLQQLTNRADEEKKKVLNRIQDLEARATSAEEALKEERSKSLWKLVVERFTK